MSDIRQAFLDAIQREPNNYSHRYVYADWLDEHGEHEEADRQRKYEMANTWMLEFARKLHLDRDELVDAGVRFLEGGGQTGYDSLSERYRENFDKFPKYWEMLEVITGKPFTDPRSGRVTQPGNWTPFRCVC